MQLDVSPGAFFDEGVEEEGEVLFDITGVLSGPLEDEAEADVPPDRPSFNEVVQDHIDDMVCNARRLTGDRAHADDVVQEALVRALHAWDRFEVEADHDFDAVVGAWLHQIVTHAFINLYHQGKRAVRRTTAWAASQQVIGTTVDDPREHLDSPFGDEVATALASLNGDQRKAVEMHYLRGMSGEEIAGELGCSKNTVFTRLARARETLGPLLQKYARSAYGIGREVQGDDNDVDESDVDAVA